MVLERETEVGEQRRVVGGERERLLEQVDRAGEIAGCAAEVAQEEQRLGIAGRRATCALPACARPCGIGAADRLGEKLQRDEVVRLVAEAPLDDGRRPLELSRTDRVARRGNRVARRIGCGRCRGLGRRHDGRAAPMAVLVSLAAAARARIVSRRGGRDRRHRGVAGASGPSVARRLPATSTPRRDFGNGQVIAPAKCNCGASLESPVSPGPRRALRPSSRAPAASPGKPAKGRSARIACFGAASRVRQRILPPFPWPTI